MDEVPLRADAAAPDLLSIGAGVLLLLALGGFAGWWAGQRGVADAAAQAQTRGAQAAIESLNADLLAMVRRALDDPSRRTQLDAALNELDAASQGVTAAVPGDPVKEPLRHLDAARGAVRQVRDDQERASRTMRAIEEAARAPRLDPEEVKRVIEGQGAILGAICLSSADAAAKSGDLLRAQFFLEQAMRADPARLDVYRRRLTELQGSAGK